MLGLCLVHLHCVWLEESEEEEETSKKPKASSQFGNLALDKAPTGLRTGGCWGRSTGQEGTATLSVTSPTSHKTAFLQVEAKASTLGWCLNHEFLLYTRVHTRLQGEDDEVAKAEALNNPTGCCE